jgi:hypothetical protein
VGNIPRRSEKIGAPSAGPPTKHLNGHSLRTTLKLTHGTGIATGFVEPGIIMKHTPSSHTPASQPSVPSGIPPESIDAEAFRVGLPAPSCHAIRLDSCMPFEHIAVRTRRTDYEVVVLPGSTGDVLVRGGRFFEEFQRARLAGSTFGGTAIRVHTIEVGCALELQVDGTRIVTSPIEAVSRVRADGQGPCVM